VSDSDVSHVLPECFGNFEAQVLPKGTVCRSCNNYFGSKIEPALIEDPRIHAICVILRVVDPGDANVFRDRLFDDKHPSVAPPQRNLGLNLTVRNNALELDVSYEIKGTLRREHDRRSVAWFSRAIHKLAFESFVWLQMQPDPKLSKMDPFSESFRPLRRWTRYGEPNGRVRPVARMPASSITHEWEPRLWGFDEHFALELRLFGDWLAVSLTSSPADAEEHLRRWCSGSARTGWLIGDTFGPLGTEKSTGTA
jgi:hypothetical protein